MQLNLNDKPANQEAERSPEEAAITMWLRVLVTMRWVTILGIVVATLVASFAFRINFPTLPAYGVAVFVALCNLGLLYQARSLKVTEASKVVPKARTFGSTHFLLDLVAFTALIHFTGGVENPFIFYFVFHTIGAGIILRRSTAYLLATSVIVLVGLVNGLEYGGVIPHVNLAGFADPMLYRQASYNVAVLVVLAIALYATTFMSTTISGERIKRQRQIVELRERLLEKRTGELAVASSELAKLEEERNRFLRFLGIAAHDLKAPLAAIQSYFGVMLGGFAGQLSEKQRNMVERSSKRVVELLTLISDLLDIPRIETGQIVQEMKQVSVKQVIENSVDELGNLAKQKNIALETELDPNLPDIHGSATRLKQVLNNLVSNAINYTQEGKVTIRAKAEGDNVVIEVMDTGIGIPAQDLPRMFEDFFRASNVEVKGTGLGLSIARRIVEAHCGKISVESPCRETNTGSKFTITLPQKCEAGRRRQL